MDIRITCPQDPPPTAIVNAWGSRLRDLLTERYPGPFTVAWTEDKEAPSRTPPAFRQWLAIGRGRTFRGRIGLRWDRAQPGLLQVRTELDALPKPDNPFNGVLNVLEWILGLAAFGCWVWFAIADWSRIWNRVFSLQNGYDATHATNLEVVWLLLGWALSPAVAVLAIELIRSRVEAMVAAWQCRRVQSFTRKDLDPGLEAAVQSILKNAAEDPAHCLAFGQAHIGQPHPTLQNLVWAADGRYQPAAGFTWASVEPGSLDVVPKAVKAADAADS